jgi:hypothetical protein
MTTQKWNWAPKHYREDWQHARRISGLPFGYFDRSRFSSRGTLLVAGIAWLVLVLLVWALK